MSAIVADPVPPWVGPALVCCILAPPQDLREERCYSRRRLRRRRSCGRHLRTALLLYVGQEQGLVDSALEDRHAQLHALLNDLATLHAGFASELRGREMDCHQYESSW